MQRLLFGALLAATLISALHAEEDDAELRAKLEAATRRVAGEQYDLRYKYKKGDVFHWNVIHLATVETRIQGTSQTARTRTESTKQWRVLDAKDDGSVTIEHSIVAVKMWQQTSGREAIEYDSTNGEDPPAEYKEVAKTVGKPLTVVTIDPHGTIIERDGKSKTNVQFTPGGRDFAILLPPEAVKIGHKWSRPQQIRLKAGSGQVKTVKTRQLYTLSKVEHGLATIEVKTQVLTPVNDAKIKAQLMQTLFDGEVKFDIDAGNIIHQKMDLDEVVLGFNGGDSMMQYLARFIEKLQPVDETAVQATQEPAAETTQKPVQGPALK